MPIIKSVRCHAKCNSTGQQCKKAAIAGGRVCLAHGGKAPQVRRAAAERLADLIDPDRALRQLAALAYSDVTEVINEAGQIKPVKEWPAALRMAVGGIELVRKNVTAGDGVTDDVIKLKLWDKVKALEMLMKHLGLLEDRIRVIDDEAIAKRLDAGRRRMIEGRAGAK